MNLRSITNNQLKSMVIVRPLRIQYQLVASSSFIFIPIAFASRILSIRFVAALSSTAFLVLPLPSSSVLFPTVKMPFLLKKSGRHLWRNGLLGKITVGQSSFSKNLCESLCRLNKSRPAELAVVYPVVLVCSICNYM